ncbi:MAG: dimethylargininase [Chloroflexi bacterium]|nr:dimethylargininase [Chloroflexota bacterium]
MLIAITRKVSPAIQQCELTHLKRTPIDFELAEQQHAQYEKALATVGCTVNSLNAEPELPDSVFVEDIAIVLDECALITRPGADSRKPEIESIANALSPHRELMFVQAPGMVDGGDVLRIGKTLYVGLSSRSNQEAVEQMQQFLRPYGYVVKGVKVDGCLHLKTAVTQVTPDTILLNPAWINATDFPGMNCITVDPSEPNAANALLIGDTIIYPTAYPKTQARLAEQNIPMQLVDVSELTKAEGAVTCCSLVFVTK